MLAQVIHREHENPPPTRFYPPTFGRNMACANRTGTLCVRRGIRNVKRDAVTTSL
jgi:hypothetical protein